MAARYCGRCGTPNPANVAFCGNCGAPLGAGQAAVAVAAAPAGAPAAYPQYRYSYAPTAPARARVSPVTWAAVLGGVLGFAVLVFSLFAVLAIRGAFTLIVLPENQSMLGLLRRLGWIHQARFSGGVYEIRFELEPLPI